MPSYLGFSWFQMQLTKIGRHISHEGLYEFHCIRVTEKNRGNKTRWGKLLTLEVLWRMPKATRFIYLAISAWCFDTDSHSRAQTGFSLIPIFLSQCPEHWDCRHVSSLLTSKAVHFKMWAGQVVHTWNPRRAEQPAWAIKQVLVQPEQHSKTISINQLNKTQ